MNSPKQFTRSLFAPFAFLGISVGSMLCTSACDENDSAAASESSIEDDIMQQMEDAVDNGIIGMSVYLKNETETISVAKGKSNINPDTPFMPTDLFRVASVSKTFVGALTTILALEGKLDLDSPITAYLPDDITSHFDSAAQVTVRQLLNHTSGFYNYTDSPKFPEAVLADLTHAWTDKEAIVFAYDQPGTPLGEFAYSNTNYCLLGIILDTRLGHHHSVELRSRILEPLGLTSTYYFGHETVDPARIVHGYSDITGETQDFHDIDTGYGVTDGGLVSTMHDIGVFIEALATGAQFVDASIRDAFNVEFFPEGLGYGLGISVQGSPEVIGHTGGVPGYSTFMMYIPKYGTTLCVAVNIDNQSLAQNFWDALQNILDLAAPGVSVIQ